MGTTNSFALSGLQVRTDLLRKKYKHLESDPGLNSDVNAFLNHTIRTVVIRNWPSIEFLHLIFMRLNTGSVRLSPQELRQAVVPGPFVDAADDRAIRSKNLQTLLSRNTPDPRMRDVELLVRYIAMRRFLNEYGGRMKTFLDSTCKQLNTNWEDYRMRVSADLDNFELGIKALLDVFGDKGVARKEGSYSFNRAIFDALIFYAAEPVIREAMLQKQKGVGKAFEEILNEQKFSDAVESDTAGVPNTHVRLYMWGHSLRKVTGQDFNVPELSRSSDGESQRIRFQGFW